MAALSHSYRFEEDSMGSIQVPKEAYYGAQTQRAIENFPISGWRFGRETDPCPGSHQVRFGKDKRRARPPGEEDRSGHHGGLR